MAFPVPLLALVCASQQKQAANVRFDQKAINGSIFDVRFVPIADIGR
jgi:hypothetical protein